MTTIQAQEATVLTAQVEVKALTIRGRQVTLALFRQLQREDAVDMETGDWKGIPWGTVNYHPDKCDGPAKHVHLVWQKGDELRRDNLSPHRPFDKRRQALIDSYEVFRKNALLEAFLTATAGRIDPLPAGWTHRSDGGYDLYLGSDWTETVQEGWWSDALKWRTGRYSDLGYWEIDPFRWNVPYGLDNLREAAPEAYANALREDWDKVRRSCAKMATEMRGLLARRWGLTEDEFTDRRASIYRDSGRYVSRLETEIADAEARWRKRYDEAVALDQLFIAG